MLKPHNTQAMSPVARRPAKTLDMATTHRLLATLTTDGCRYPHGDLNHGDFRFCGEPTRDPGKPYCAEHHALCHTSAGSP